MEPSDHFGELAIDRLEDRPISYMLIRDSHGGQVVTLMRVEELGPAHRGSRSLCGGGATVAKGVDSEKNGSSRLVWHFVPPGGLVLDGPELLPFPRGPRLGYRQSTCLKRRGTGRFQSVSVRNLRFRLTTVCTSSRESK